MKNDDECNSTARHKVPGALVVTLCLIVSGCTLIPDNLSSFGRAENTSKADDNVARMVKSQLMASDSVEAAPLRVSVEGEAIILRGFVESVDESTEAERLTQELYPDYQVVNGITVR